MEAEVQFSQHAREKLDDSASRQLGISRERIIEVLRQPACIETSDLPLVMAVGPLTSTLSLCVVYKLVGGGVRVITFFPARRGRYEGKILPRG